MVMMTTSGVPHRTSLRDPNRRPLRPTSVGPSRWDRVRFAVGQAATRAGRLFGDPRAADCHTDSAWPLVSLVVPLESRFPIPSSGWELKGGDGGGAASGVHAPTPSPGINRSSTLCIAYLMLTMRWPLLQVDWGSGQGRPFFLPPGQREPPTGPTGHQRVEYVHTGLTPTAGDVANALGSGVVPSQGSYHHLTGA